MPDQTPQTYANHTRFDPLFHFFALPVLGITFCLTIWNFVQSALQGSLGFPAATSLVALAAVVAALKIRLYTLKVQAIRN